MENNNNCFIALVETADILTHVSLFTSSHTIAQLTRLNRACYDAVTCNDQLWQTLFRDHFPTSVLREVSVVSNGDGEIEHSKDEVEDDGADASTATDRVMGGQWYRLFNKYSNKSMQVLIGVRGSGLPLNFSVFTRKKASERARIDIRAQYTCPSRFSIPCEVPLDSRSGITYEVEAREGTSDRGMRALMKACEIYGHVMYASVQRSQDILKALSDAEQMLFGDTELFESENIVSNCSEEKPIEEVFEGWSVESCGADEELKRAYVQEMEEHESDIPLEVRFETIMKYISKSDMMHKIESFIDWMLNDFDLNANRNQYENETGTLSDVKVYRSNEHSNKFTICYFLNDSAHSPIQTLLERKIHSPFGRVRFEKEKSEEKNNYYGILLYPVRKFLNQLYQMKLHPEKHQNKVLKRTIYPKWRTFCMEMHFGTQDFLGVGPSNPYLRHWLDCALFFVLQKYMKGIRAMTMHDQLGSQIRFEWEQTFPLTEHIQQLINLAQYSTVSHENGRTNSVIAGLLDERMKDIEEEEEELRRAGVDVNKLNND